MKRYCSNCLHWQPLDKSYEIGVCFDEPKLPVVNRFRFQRETWTCWQPGFSPKKIYPLDQRILELPKPEPEAELEPVQYAEPALVTATFRRELNGQVTRAYWYVKKLERMAAKNDRLHTRF